jgi:hypothetical protein
MLKNDSKMKVYFKLKHWQLFIIWILGAIFCVLTENTPYWFLAQMFFTILLIGWIYSISKINQVIRARSRKIELVDILFLLLLIASLPYISQMRRLESSSANKFVLIGSLAISFIAFFLLVVISAKRLKGFETKQSLIVFNYMEYYLYLLFIPIGVWIIQPKLNKLITAK